MDPVLHERERLQVMTVLCSMEEGDEVLVPRVQGVTELPPDDVTAAVSSLESAGYVATFIGDRGGEDGSWIGATVVGRRRFREYMAAIAANLEGGRGA